MVVRYNKKFQENSQPPKKIYKKTQTPRRLSTKVKAKRLTSKNRLFLKSLGFKLIQ